MSAAPVVPADAKCATCQHIGRMYHSNGMSYDHMCGMSDQRRKEEMSRGADFLDHFRAFFDADAEQAACRHYVERPVAGGATTQLLRGMADNKGRGEFGFLTDEAALANKLNDMFVRYDMHAKTSKPGNRVFFLLPVGVAELERAALKETP